MKLDPDCVRAILYYVEDNTGYGIFADVKKMIETLEYDADTIMYHAMQCESSGFFTEAHWYLGGYDGAIVDLTPKAHEFIANIRNDKNWYKIKEKAKVIGSFSLSALSQIAISYVSSLIG